MLLFDKLESRTLLAADLRLQIDNEAALPSVAKPGQSFTVNVELRDPGTSIATAFSVGARLVPLPPSDWLNETAAYNNPDAINVGAYLHTGQLSSDEVIFINAVVPSNVTPNVYALIVRVDTGNAVVESDESNNESIDFNMLVISPAGAMSLIGSDSSESVNITRMKIDNKAAMELTAGPDLGGLYFRTGSITSYAIELRGGNDVLTVKGEFENMRIDAGDGNDRVVSGASSTYIAGGIGNDTLSGGVSDDTVTGGGGRNVLSGNAGNDRLNGSTGPDAIYGEAGSDRIYGFGGNDLLDGGDNVDHIRAGDGDDTVNGGSSNDYLYGEAGFDSMSGGNQNDQLDGGENPDKLYGGDGNDTIVGGGGNDFLDGGKANDSLLGGTGIDTYRNQDGFADTLIAGFGPDRWQEEQLDVATGDFVSV